MELHTHDHTLLRSCVRHFQFLISEYELDIDKDVVRTEVLTGVLDVNFVKLASKEFIPPR